MKKINDLEIVKNKIIANIINLENLRIKSDDVYKEYYNFKWENEREAKLKKHEEWSFLIDEKYKLQEEFKELKSELIKIFDDEKKEVIKNEKKIQQHITSDDY